jgi:hypothetical protein
VLTNAPNEPGDVAQLFAEWNRSHPEWRYSTPEKMRQRYERAASR